MNRLEILDERQKIYGDFGANAYTWVRFQQIAELRGWEPAQRLALEMIYVKLARLIHNQNHKDTWLDIAGYATLGAEACPQPKP